MVLPLTNPTKSYWIEAAESPLRNHRTSEKLPEEVDVVIVGSGYTGASAAYWLHKFTEAHQTPNILLLEARGICEGATARNGGLLRPAYYVRYAGWSKRFGPTIAFDLVRHEVSHLQAFQDLLEHEGLSETVCFKLGETFDAAMTEEAWERLKSVLQQMKEDQGADHEIVKACRLIENPNEAEEFTQMKGCIGAVVHPTGQIWPYKFVHALLTIVLKTGKLNLQSHTPVLEVGDKDENGWIKVRTARGEVRTKAVIHATNRWASHLLPNFSKLIFPGRGTVAAIPAPEGFKKHIGVQWWDSIVTNYHVQLPPPYNTIVVGGAKPVTVSKPHSWILNEKEDEQIAGVPEYYKRWPKSDIVGWEGKEVEGLARPDNEGGVWTGVFGTSVDSVPFVGPVPKREGHFVAAGFTGHGMPRILGCTAHLVPLVLGELKIQYSSPSLVSAFPPLPLPFHASPERIEKLLQEDAEEGIQAHIDDCLRSSRKSFITPRPASDQEEGKCKTVREILDTLNEGGSA